MPFSERNQEQIYYRVQSEDSKEAIILLHSLGTDHSLWDYQFKALEDNDLLVVAPDSRGHGRSTNQTGIINKSWTNDILAVMDDLNIDRAVLCGISMGGVQALSFAQLYPHRVSGLVLADTFARIEPEQVEQKISLTAGVAKEQGMGKYAEMYLDQTLSTSNEAMKMRESLRSSISTMEYKAYEAAATACFSVDVAEGLKDIQVPTLVLVGEEDLKTPLPMSEYLANNIPNAEISIIPKGKHLANIDNPVAFNQLLINFLRTFN